MPDVLITHIGGATAYMVASASTAGAYYLVRMQHSEWNDGRAEFPITCTCPAGTERPETSCRHMRAAVAFVRAEDERNRRPTMPVNVAALTD